MFFAYYAPLSQVKFQPRQFIVRECRRGRESAILSLQIAHFTSVLV
jgi:hypothetical protein